MSAINDAGVTAEQIHFECTFIRKFREYLDFKQDDGLFMRHGERGELAYNTGSELYLFSRFLIAPLLRIHGLYDASTAPRNEVLYFLVTDGRLKDEYDRDELRAMVLFAARTFKMPPELWIERWAMHSSATADIQSAVSKEYSRSIRERIMARKRGGLDWGHLGLAGYRELAIEGLGMKQDCEACVREKHAKKAEDNEKAKEGEKPKDNDAERGTGGGDHQESL